MPLDLAVIESRWWEGSNSSVRGLFDLLTDIHEDNPSAYHYEMFNNADSLREIMCRVAPRMSNIYIASHANEDILSGAEGEEENAISRTHLRNTLKYLGGQGSSLDGLYFGSCGFMNRSNAIFLWEEDGVDVSWMAGYSGAEIDWIDLSVVDLYFWNTYYYGSRKRKIRKRIKYVAKTISEFMPGVCSEELRFNIFIPDRRDGGVRALLPE